MNETVQSARVPGTEVVISIMRINAEGRTYWVIRRDPGDIEPFARTGNYMEMGRVTEAEAREAANFLWSDTVARRIKYDAEQRETTERAAWAARAETVEVTEGVWKMPDGTIYKIQTSRGYGGGQAGNLYGKKLVKLDEPVERTRYRKTYTVEWELAYAPGAVRIVATGGGVKLDDEAAAAVGRLAGVCMFCGRDLTDERSQNVGYGKDCADKRGLPWGEMPMITNPTE